MTSRHAEPLLPASAAALPLRFSFVIANFNYGRFVGEAIESALGQDWPAIEVIVVDDGSSDDSRKVISAFGKRITALFQPNRGQRIANNAGFAASHGDVVVFLDADDVLERGFCRAVAGVWHPAVSKVQVQMARIDGAGHPLGTLVPAIAVPPTARQIHTWAASACEYPTPPGSGNAYSRAFLSRFFPIGPEHDSSTDSTCLALAPLLGDVETVLVPLASYRIHGENDSNLAAAPDRFGREVRRAIVRQKSAEDICRALGEPGPEPGCINQGRHLLQLRAASLRLAPGSHPAEAGGWVRTLGDALLALRPYGYDSPRKRLLAVVWTLAVLFAPQAIVRRLVDRRFARSGHSAGTQDPVRPLGAGA